VYAASTAGNVTYSEVRDNTDLTLPTVRDAAQRLRQAGLVQVDNSHPVTFHAVALPDPGKVEADLLGEWQVRRELREQAYEIQVTGSRQTRERVSDRLLAAEQAAKPRKDEMKEFDTRS